MHCIFLSPSNCSPIYNTFVHLGGDFWLPGSGDLAITKITFLSFKKVQKTNMDVASDVSNEYAKYQY
jgi:hypothetical protein